MPTPRRPAHLEAVEIVGELLAPFEITVGTTPFARKHRHFGRKMAESPWPVASL